MSHDPVKCEAILSNAKAWSKFGHAMGLHQVLWKLCFCAVMLKTITLCLKSSSVKYGSQEVSFIAICHTEIIVGIWVCLYM